MVRPPTWAVAVRGCCPTGLGCLALGQQTLMRCGWRLRPSLAPTGELRWRIRLGPWYRRTYRKLEAMLRRMLTTSGLIVRQC